MELFKDKPSIYEFSVETLLLALYVLCWTALIKTFGLIVIVPAIALMYYISQGDDEQDIMTVLLYPLPYLMANFDRFMDALVSLPKSLKSISAPKPRDYLFGAVTSLVLASTFMFPYYSLLVSINAMIIVAAICIVYAVFRFGYAVIHNDFTTRPDSGWKMLAHILSSVFGVMLGGPIAAVLKPHIEGFSHFSINSIQCLISALMTWV